MGAATENDTANTILEGAIDTVNKFTQAYPALATKLRPGATAAMQNLIITWAKSPSVFDLRLLTAFRDALELVDLEGSKKVLHDVLDVFLTASSKQKTTDLQEASMAAFQTMDEVRKLLSVLKACRS